jgi:hypothetical protein
LTDSVINDGVWAGDCFDIVTIDRVESEDNKKGWKDVFDHVTREKEEIWECQYCTISIYSVQPCDRDMFGGFGISVRTFRGRDTNKFSVDCPFDVVNSWVTG